MQRSPLLPDPILRLLKGPSRARVEFCDQEGGEGSELGPGDPPPRLLFEPNGTKHQGRVLVYLVPSACWTFVTELHPPGPSRFHKAANDEGTVTRPCCPIVQDFRLSSLRPSSPSSLLSLPAWLPAMKPASRSRSPLLRLLLFKQLLKV